MDSAARCPHCHWQLGENDAEGKRCPRCERQLDALANTVTSAPAQQGVAREAPPEHIGRYRILQTLGGGGMGIVYLAEQTDPIRRRVAVKVIKPGLDSHEVLNRFAAERQALALMTHPNIARIFDAGVTEQGRPFFVMEYVPGVRITDYCDMRCLPLRDRLELFASVCDAVQHAHQKGIVHRDLKPSNIIVSSVEGKPTPKVIDFGLAKATGATALCEALLVTSQGVLLGTPEYMSPEQAGTSPFEIDARTDIYSLGVLLYELLVGALPFEPSTLRRAAAVEMLRIIAEEEPPTMQTRLRSLGDTAAEIARRRHTDLRSLDRDLQGELDWITVKAMEKDPDRRYPSASELAADVRRHLGEEPVAAGPPDQWYRLGKVVRRHRRAVAAAGALVAVLLAGLIVSTVFYVRAENARAQAVLEAERSALEAESLQAVLLGDASRHEQLSGRAMQLHRTALRGKPALAAHAVNRLILFDVWDAGRHDPAVRARRRELQSEARELVDRALSDGGLDAVKTALLLAPNLQPREADALKRRVLKVLQHTPRTVDPTVLDGLEELLARLDAQSLRPLERGADDAIERAYRASLARRERFLPIGSPALAEAHERLAAVLERKGARLLRTRDPEAVIVFRETLERLQQSREVPPERAAKVRSDLGAALASQSQTAEAERLLLEAAADLERIRGRENAHRQEALNRLAELYEASGRPDAASRVRQRLPRVFVAAASDLGPLRVSDGLAAEEGGSSALLDGESTWMFGDTFASTRLLDGTRGIDLRTQGTRLSLTADEVRFNSVQSDDHCVDPCGMRWVLTPRTIVADQRRERLIVFVHRTLHNNFGPHDPGLASLAVCTSGGRECRTAATFLRDEPHWGSAAMIAGDDLYMYACSTAPGQLNATCLLARVPTGSVTERSAWRYFAGETGWSSDWRVATPVLEGGIQSGSFSIHWSDLFRKYIAVSSRVIDTRVDIRTADKPEGPWSETEIEIDTLHSGPSGWVWTNWGFAHPELARDGGRTEYFTYRRRLGEIHETRMMEVRFEKSETAGTR